MMTLRSAVLLFLSVLLYGVPISTAQDVSVIMGVDPVRPVVGQQVELRFVVLNVGADAATGVSVQLQSEFGGSLAYETFETETGTFDSDNFTWSVGSVSAGASREGTLTATWTGMNGVDVFTAALSGVAGTSAVKGIVQADHGTDGGTAFEFDGVDDNVRIPDANALDMTSTFTLMTWVRPDLGANGTLISHDDDGQDTSGAYNLAMNGSDVSYETNNQGWVGASDVLDSNEWNHVAVSFDESASPTTRIYVNGALVASGDTAAPSATSGPVWLGRRGIADAFFEGMLDEVSIWNVALTAGDIQSGLMAPLGGAEAGLVAYYRADGDGSSAVDATGSGHDGVLNNGLSRVGNAPPLKGAPDIDIEITSDVTRAAVGDDITFTVTVTNDGPALTGLDLEHYLRRGEATFVSATPDAGTYDGASSRWTLDTLPKGTSETFELVMESQEDASLLVLAVDAARAHQTRPDGGPLAGSFTVFRTILPILSGTGNALTLDGSDDRVVVPYGALLDSPEALTVEAWVYVTKPGNTALFTRAAEGSNATGDYGINLLSNGSIEWDVQNFGYVNTAPGVVARDTWHHVAVTYKETANPRLIIYVDGNPVLTANDGTGGGSIQPTTGSNGLLIGSRGSDLFFGGLMDDFAYWRTARTAEQIQESMTGVLIGNEPGLAALHRYEIKRNLAVNNDGADDAQDHAGNGLHGDLEGGADIAETVMPKRPSSVLATDDFFEERVDVTWELPEDSDATLVRVLRDGQLLNVVSSQNSLYEDPDGDPNTISVYCVVTETGAGDRSTLGCDGGRRRLLQPADVSASQSLFEDRVDVLWSDRSVYNTGYAVFRDGTQVATLGGNTEVFSDMNAEVDTDHEYCVVPTQDGVEGHDRVCVTGRRADTLPPLQVAATDGTMQQIVRISWLDQGEGATGFEIRRDGALLTTVSADVLSFDDLQAVSGTVHSYCVRRVVDADASIDICDAGSINTLPAPNQVVASTDAFDDRVEVTWNDRAGHESGYRVYRRGGAALTFDGTDDVIEVPAEQAFDRTSMTFEAWVRPTAFGSVRSLFDKGDPRNFDVLLLADGTLHVATHSQTCVELQLLNSAEPLPLNEWTHIAATVSPTKATIYVDGLVSASSNLAGVCKTSKPVRLGGGRFDSFAGSMDELRLWGDVRTRDQVRTTMFSRLEGNEAGLVAYWPLDAGTGTTASDAFGIHDGTLSGFALSDAEPGWTVETAPFAQHGTGLALVLDGVDDHVRIQDATDLDLQTFTVETWLNPTASVESQLIVGKAGNFSLERLENDHIRLQMRPEICTDPMLRALESTSPVSTGRWTHLAVSYDGSTAKLYVNGALDREVEATGPVCENNDQLLIGGGSVGNFSGELDRTRIWNTARTASDIVQVMHESAPDAAEGLVLELEYDARTGSGAGVDGFQGLMVNGTLPSASVELVGYPRLDAGRSALLGLTAADREDFVDLNAVPGVSYTYCIAAYTNQGVETATACDNGRRSPAIGPDNVQASDLTFEDRVEITWANASSRTSVFKVYRDDVLLRTLPVTTLSMTDTGIPSDTDLNYCVSGVSAEGVESFKACDVGSRSMERPTEVAASDAEFEARVDITWVDNSEIERGYRVYRREVLNTQTGELAADSALVAETVASQAEAVDRGGIPRTTYRYSVVAFDNDGHSLTGTDRGMRRLRKPAALMAQDRMSETTIRLTWEDRSQVENGYRVFRDGVEIAELDKNVTRYVDTNPPFNQVVTYGLEAFDEHGATDRVEDEGATTLLTPGTVSATEGYTDRVTVTWVDRSEVETGYRVYRNGSFLGDVAANVTTYSDHAAPSGTNTYCVATETGGTESEQVCDTGLVFIPADPPAFLPLDHSLVADDGQAPDEFGITVSIAGNQMMIGAWFQDDFKGAVYVYERQTSGWVFKQKLIASDSKPDADFGGAISMTSSWAVIGSRRHNNTIGNEREGDPDNLISSDYGRAYFFKRTPDGWEEVQAVTHDFLHPGARFGSSVSTDGNFALLAAPGDNVGGVFGIGSVYIYKRDGDNWQLDFAIGNIGAKEGAIDGDRAAFSSSFNDNPGAFRVVKRTGNTWQESSGIGGPMSVADGGNSFGSRVDVSRDLVAVSADRADYDGLDESGVVYIYRMLSENNVELLQEIVPENHQAGLAFGKSLSLDGDRLLVGANNQVYLFEKEGDGSFEQVAIYRGTGATPDFGRQVTLSPVGDILVGDPAGFGNPERGRVFFDEVDPIEPANVAATNGKFQNRVEISWEDQSDNEDGFRIFRDGELIDVTGSDITSFSDINAVPGIVHQYCVQSLRAVYEDVSEQICDIGWRFPDGAIAGKVRTGVGDPSQNIEVCMAPTPNGSLVLDGHEGQARSMDSTTLPESFTIEFWVKRSDGATGKDIAFSHGTPSQNTGLLAGFRDDDTFTFGFFLNDLNGPQISDVRWHHMALTYDATTNRRAIVHNGVEVASDTSPADYSGDGPFYVGSQHGTDIFNGQIDEIRIWNHVVPVGIIQSRMDQTIDPSLPDLGLFAHWALDERSGSYAANDVDISGAFYLHHEGGAAPARPGAPLRACDISDEGGDFSFSGIRYGESTEYRLSPQDPGDIVRTFLPTVKLLTLNRQNPVQNELEFIDLTKHSIAGVVQFDGTECPVTDALFDVRSGDAIPGTFESDEDGDYNASADPGQIIVEPYVNNDDTRIFSPEILTRELTEDIYEQNFTDLTTRTLSGQVVGTGMCRLPIGVATLEIRATNGCLVQEVITDEDGNYSVDLPPMEYTVRLKSLDNDNAQQRVDIEQYFEDQGAQIVDLAEGSLEHDLVYRAPLSVTIAGLEPSMCSTGDIPDNLPVLTRGDPMHISVSVAEDLGVLGSCPVESGTVTLFSEISDETNTPIELVIEEGMVDTTLTVGAPNVLSGRIVDGVDRSFQKFITASADVDGRTEDTTEWAVVEGTRPRPGGRFATTPVTPVPLLVLRDPPGDGSVAFFEKDSTVCTEISTEAALEFSVDFTTEVVLGIVADAGVAFGGEATVEVEQSVEFGISQKVYLRQTLGYGFELCLTTDETIATSGEADFAGPDADLFMGTGVNFIFAKADRLVVDECEVDVDDVIAFGPKLDTGFMFTREHIENRMIPDLKELRDHAESDDERNEFEVGLENWSTMLSNHDVGMDMSEWSAFDGDARNRSFSAGAEYEFGKSRSTAHTFSTETTVGVAVTAFFGQKVGAAGSEGVQRVTFDTDISLTLGTSTTLGEGSRTGYAFSDDDQGDNFTVDVTTDPVYGTPSFDVKAGLSSCPYEPWMGVPLVQAPGSTADPDDFAPRMTARDAAELSMNPIQRLGLDPSAPAVFTVNLGNASPSDETRSYGLSMLSSSNPGGAILEAAGTRLGVVDFTIPPGEVHQTGLSVTRGPEKYDYPNLALTMFPVCEGAPIGEVSDQGSSVLFNVSFTPPCSDISIFRPKENWVLNRETVGSPMEIVLVDFTLAENDVDAGVQRIGFEYRRVGTSDWQPGEMYSRADIIAQSGADADSYVAEWTFPDQDGTYEIRAYTECDSGRNYSDVVLGTVDTIIPEILKTPEPADAVMQFGDDIAITLNEDVLCASIITGGQNPNTFLRRKDTGDAIAIEAVCDGRVAVLSPQDPDVLDDLEGLTLEASLEDWTDMVGNPVTESVTWEFEVRRSAFTWSPVATSTTIKLGTTGVFEATLTNGKPTESVDFTLAAADSWLVPNVEQGTLPAESQATIDFTIQNFPGVGQHETTVTATSGSGDTSVLTVMVNVFDECEAPTWNVNPTSFEHDMTLTAQVYSEGVVSKDANDMVAAFVGDQIRGVAPVVPFDANDDTVPDGNRVNMVVYSNQANGEQVTFKVFDQSDCTVHESTSLTLTFDATAVHGTPQQPITLQAPAPAAVPGSVALNSGWTWFSINMTPSDASVAALLANVPAVEANIVKSQRYFSLFDPTAGWVGTLSSLDPRSGYLIKLNQSHAMDLVGVPVDVTTTPVDIVPGWNWIGYLPQAELDVNTALASLTPATNDIVKSQFEFAQYVEGSGWIGSLSIMEPGLGYQIRVAGADVIEYPDAGPPPALAVQSDDEVPALRLRVEGQGKNVDDSAPAVAHAGEETTDVEPVGIARRMSSQNLACAVNPADYQYSLTMTAVVQVDGVEARSSDIEVAGFVRNGEAAECRGVGTLQYVEALDRYFAFVVLYGNVEGESIDLTVFDPASEQALPTDKALSFASNGVFGTVQTPLEVGASLSFSTATEDISLPTEFGLSTNYPNPFSDVTTIGYDVPRPENVRITVYDVLGRRVAVLKDSEQAAGRYEIRFETGRLAPGTYIYRMEAGTWNESRIMVLAR